MPKKKWNPRFEFYANAHGRTPEQQVEHDKKHEPNLRNFRFVQWVRKHWRKYEESCRLVHVRGLQGAPGSGWSYRDTSPEGFTAFMGKAYPHVQIAW